MTVYGFVRRTFLLLGMVVILVVASVIVMATLGKTLKEVLWKIRLKPQQMPLMRA